MARGRGQGPQRRPVKGFRPGKEPPELKKRRARQEFGDMNAAQERLVDLFADRTPDQARRLIRRWRVGLLAAGVLLAVLAVALFFWSTVAGIIVALLAGVAFFLWWRLHRQQEAFDTMADAVSGTGGGGRPRGSRRRRK